MVGGSVIPLALPFDAWLEIYIGRGRRRRLVHRQPARSPVKNWAELIRGFFANSDATVVDRTGASCVIDTQANQGYCNYGYTYTGLRLRVNAPADDDSFGLVFGYGTSPVTPDDYELAAPYKQGTGSLYLDYDVTNVAGVDIGTVTIDTKTYTAMVVKVSRSAVNQHSAAQTITEVGLVVSYEQPRVTGCKFLVMRDVLDQPIDVPAYDTVTVSYYLRFLIPS